MRVLYMFYISNIILSNKALLTEKKPMTVDLAYRLYFYFGVSAEYWLNFQKNYDLKTYQELAENQIKDQIQPYQREQKRA